MRWRSAEKWVVVRVGDDVGDVGDGDGGGESGR